MGADRGSRYVADVLADYELGMSALAAELFSPRLISHFAPIRLAIDQDVDVFDGICRIDCDQKRDLLILSLHIPGLGKAKQGSGPGNPEDRYRVHLDGIDLSGIPKNAADRLGNLLGRDRLGKQG